MRARSEDSKYSQMGYYYVTVCTRGMSDLLGKVIWDLSSDEQYVELNETGTAVKRHIDGISSMFGTVSVDKYVIMPNHIHIVAVVDVGLPGDAPHTKAMLAKAVDTIKELSSKQYGEALWQRTFHEQLIGSEADYRLSCQYIDENPMRWSRDEFFVGDEDKAYTARM